MMNIIRLLVLTTILVTAGASMLSAQELPSEGGSERALVTIDDLIAEAIRQNASLETHRLRYQAAKAKIPQSSALPDAKLGFGFFAVPVETRLGPQQATVSFSQTFPWFGTLGAQEAAAEAFARRHAQEYADSRNRLVVDIRAAWYALHVNERNSTLLREHQKLLAALRALALARYEAGGIPFSHLLRLDMELESLEAQAGYAADSRGPLLEKLSRIVNRDLTFEELLLPESLEVPDAAPGGDTELQPAESNPRLRMFTEERAYWDAQEQAARRQGYPAFTLGLTYTAIGPREDLNPADNGRDAVLPQVGLSFPLFGSRYSAMEEEAQLRGLAAQAARDDVRRLLSTEFAEAQRDLTDARRRYTLSLRLRELSRSTYEVMLQEYTTGAATLEEVLAVERDILRHALDEVNARADIARATDKIMYLTAQE
ncbi:MAG: hypothetical protein C0600_07340 [Ignavibacteria bacterium]|nr:MAG: hypothetical protein C0600_07340 [Ignavibacteria bacterium]